jgi:glycine cleavage system transcriptional repressor
VTIATRVPLNIKTFAGGVRDGTERVAMGASKATDPYPARRLKGTLLRLMTDSRSPPTMKQLIAISALGNDRTGMVHALTQAIIDCGGNIVESHMAALGSEFVISLLISGNWHSLAKVETEIKKVADAGEMTIQLKRTEPRPPRIDMMPYSIDIVCLDQPGIVASVTGFFAARGIDVAELDSRSYPAAHTSAPMFSVRVIINVPSRIHLGVLREEFMDFCDHLNLDAILEPVKN